jgi:hypothetical protein
MTLNASGNLGVGETNPQARLMISGDSADMTGTITYSTNTKGIILNQDAGGGQGMGIWFRQSGLTAGIGSTRVSNGDWATDLRFYTHPAATSNQNILSERMRINSEGNVGIGTTNPVNTLTIQNTGENAIEWHRSNAMQGMIGIPSASNQIITGSVLNDFCFRATTKMLFATGGDIERMRITSDGHVLIHATEFNSSLVGQLFGTTGDTYFTRNANPVLWLNRLSNDGVILTFQKDNSIVGTISTNSNSLPSDKNFKKNISNLELGLNLVTKLRAVSYNHKIDDDDAALSTGFIAQEFEQSLTELGIKENEYYILQHKPNEDAKQSQYWLDYTKIIPVLVKAIQELKQELDTLKNK